MKDSRQRRPLDVGRWMLGVFKTSIVRHPSSNNFDLLASIPGVLFFPKFVFAEELRDIRGPVSLSPDVWPWLVLGLVLVAGAIVSVFLRRKRRKADAPVIPPRPAWEIALEGLGQLEKSRFLAEGRFKEYYSLLSDIVRTYIEARFEIRAPEMTTEEFLAFTYASEKLNDRQRKFLGELLQSSDMVKFAKFIPQIDHARENLRLARTFIEETRPVQEEALERKSNKRSTNYKQ